MSDKFGNVSKESVEKFYEIVSKNVKKYREEKGLSQLQLALDIGIKSAAFYSNCENCRYGKHFNLEHIYKISKVLDIKICDFFDGVEEIINPK